ncbi:MAG: adenylate kinase family protein [Xenococcaceae cyanobacterium]
MRLVILGGTGAGKGTQSQRLCDRLKIPGISTGEVLRDAIASQTPLGCQAQAYLERGELVPDELMIQFMRQRLLQPDVSNGWLMEGYPRTAFQAEELDFLLDELEQRLDWAIYLQVSESVMIERSLARSLIDDEPEIIRRRIQMFQERTIPILEYYDLRQRLLTIQADQPPDLVEQEILAQLNHP